jgi:hypothetical protein
VMLRTTRVLSAALFLLGAISLSGCGLYMPDKNPLLPDTLDSNKISSGGAYEDLIVRHIRCETAAGLKAAYDNLRTQDSKKLEWLKKWGTAITLAITAEDQSGLSPGLSLTTPFENKIFTFKTGGNVTSPQSFVFGIGGSATASATRTETIQFTYLNKDLLYAADIFVPKQPDGIPCQTYQRGLMIEGDLKIWEFIYDKAVIAANGNAAPYAKPTEEKDVPTGQCNCNGKPATQKKQVPIDGSKVAQQPDWPLFNTFTENITFTATFGGNVTPTWKLARVSANSSANLLSATRTNTNQLTITLGPVETLPDAETPAQLKQAAQTQHDNNVLSGLIGTATMPH